MRKLLNTIYVTNDKAYLALDGENLVCKCEDEILIRVPFDNIENIVCFSYIGCSPALMGKCVSKCIPINFISPQGKFLAKVCGETKGNVHLRVMQIEAFEDNNIQLIRNTMAAKFSNSLQVIRRTLHDSPELRGNESIEKVVSTLKDGIIKLKNADSAEEILGIEGNCAQSYFSIFNYLIKNNNQFSRFEFRSKRPPLDPVNAMLSFVYTILTYECAAGLETVGLDSYIGFYHSLRSGRVSLACDMVEEMRCIAERFVFTLLNLRIITEKDFECEISGAVYLNAEGRKKLLTKWQEKKRATIRHPYLNQKIPLGLLPYVQSNLLAKYVRGEIEEYPPFLVK